MSWRRRPCWRPRPVDRHGDAVCNTKQMEQYPLSGIDLDELEPWQREGAAEDVHLHIAIPGEMFKKVVNYPIIVEMWDKRKSGRVKRAWLKEFTESERNLMSRYYAKFYVWYFRTGTPHRVIGCKMKTLDTLRRAVHFFATI